MSARNPERGDAAVQAALLAAQMNKGRGAQPDTPQRFVLPGGPKSPARNAAPVIRQEQSCPYHGPGGPPAADGGAPTAMALGIPADGSVDSPDADTAVLPEEQGASAEPTESLFHPQRVDVRVGVADPSVDIPRDEPRPRRRRFSIRSLKDLRVGEFINLSRSMRRGRENIPHSEYQPVDNQAPFAERAEQRSRAINVTKEERNTLIGFATEDIWEGVARIRKDFHQRGSPSGLGVIKTDNHGREESRRPITDTRNGHSSAFLKGRMRDIISLATIKYITERERQAPSGVPDEALSQEGRNYRRLTELARLLNANGTETNPKPGTPALLLHGGVRNAVSTQWALYEVAKPAFENTYGHRPTKADLDQLYDSADAMTIDVATGQLTVSLALLGHLTTNQEEFSNGGDRKFSRDDFTVVEEKITAPDGSVSTRKKLAIRKEVYAEYSARLNHALKDNADASNLERIDEDTTGCPVVHAEIHKQLPSEADANMKRVITSFVSWTRQVAVNHYDAYLAAT